MATSTRKVEESPVWQGSDENIAYVFDFTEVGVPVSPAVTIVNRDTNTDVTATCSSGTATVNGYQVTTTNVFGLTANLNYRLTCRVTVGTNLVSAYTDIITE